MTALALAIASGIALPLGWLLFYHRRLAGPVLGVLGILYTIPSIALIIFLIPFFGLNARSVIVALVVYCQIILVRNVLAGLDSIDPAILEAARGMGMNSWQIAWRVQLPLALPVILAGMRIAGVVAVAIATVGAKFGAGGLGTLLFDGIAQAGRTDKILTGGLLVGVLAFLLNRALLALEHRFTPQIQAPRRPA
ncbi:MAG: ABC transporter permease [Chloroflexi bacterium]|nr:ABC transporter permease [Chloroflexota bacterium]